MSRTVTFFLACQNRLHEAVEASEINAKSKVQLQAEIMRMCNKSEIRRQLANHLTDEL